MSAIMTVRVAKVGKKIGKKIGEILHAEEMIVIPLIQRVCKDIYLDPLFPPNNVSKFVLYGSHGVSGMVGRANSESIARYGLATGERGEEFSEGVFSEHHVDSESLVVFPIVEYTDIHNAAHYLQFLTLAEAEAFIAAVEKEIEDFYSNYTSYVSTLR